MFRTVILAAPLVLVLSLCLSTSADARRWKYYNGYERTERKEDDTARRARATKLPEMPIRGSGALSLVVEQLISGCGQQAGELRNLPFVTIAHVTTPDEVQGGALEALRETTSQAAERLASDCPPSMPAEPAVRLEAVERAMDAATAAFASVLPALQKFYSALDDEQKARLLRDMTLAHAPVSSSERTAKRSGERLDRRSSRWRAYASADRNAAVKGWDGVCEQFISALRGWPIREIEGGVGLSEPQRITFYEFVISALRAADMLAGACPAETALTPVGRMATLRARLDAVRVATALIRPAFTHFYDSLDEAQQVRFAGMN
ncbi:MAG: Spy/CpxP family protein refolding chaperone [Methyloceanibacter sp.]